MNTQFKYSDLKTKTYTELLCLREKMETFLNQQDSKMFPSFVEYIGFIRNEIASRIGK